MNWISKIKFSDGAALASVIVAAVAAYYSYMASTYVQDRQVVIEETRALDKAGQDLLEAGAAFIASINKSADLGPSRDKLRVLLAQQAMSSAAAKARLRPSDVVFADQYVDALRELSAISMKTSAPSDMRPWAESFGRVLDTRTNLSQALSARIGSKL